MSRPTTSRRRPRTGLLRPLLLLLLAGQAAGCWATRSEVSEIVRGSNDAVLATTLDLEGVPSAPDESAPADWVDTVRRIEAFIAAHPDRTTTNAALRMREAMLLLAAGQYNLAAAVFDEIGGRSELVNVRDRTLFDVRESLLWWYEEAGDPTGLDEPGRDRAREALERIVVAVEPLPSRADVRRFLERERLRIALRLAASLSRLDPIRETLASSLTRYLGQFDPEERALIGRWHRDPDSFGTDQARDLIRRFRWYDFVPCAVEDVQELWSLVSEPGAGPLQDPSWAWAEALPTDGCS